MEEYMSCEQTICQELPVPKKKKKTGLLILVVILLLGALAAAAFFFTRDLRAYANAQALYEAGDYQTAATQFEALGDYKDAPHQYRAALYAYAEGLLKAEGYAEAVTLYEQLGDYKESRQRMQKCYYHLGEAAISQKEPDTAIAYLELAKDFADAPQLRLQTIYEEGHRLFLLGSYDQAEAYFAQLEGWWPQNGGPHFAKIDEALDYLKLQAEELAEAVTLVVKDMPGSYILVDDLLNATIKQYMGYQYAQVTYDEKEQTVTVVPDYYPGQRILWAWEHDDLSCLDEAELQAYEVAVDLVEQAKAEVGSDDLIALELWLHDWICDNVVYHNPSTYVNAEDYVGLRELTCIGAFLDGDVNCQGYTDAFYVLGTMAGMEIYKVFGASEEGHCWNAIWLNDWLYTVDVTYADTALGEDGEQLYVWFNNALSLDEYMVNGGVIQFYKMATRKDLSQTYYAYNGLVYENMDDAAYELLVQYRKNGSGSYQAVVEGQWDADDFYDSVGNTMGRAGVYNVQWQLWPVSYLGDTYLYLQWM